MRLRRETGDYSIKFTETVTSVTIPTGLSAEDFVGAIVSIPTETGDALAAVITAVTTENGIALSTALETTFTYDPVTGTLEQDE